MNEFIIPQSFVGLLYEDGAYIKSLAPGRHEFKDSFFGPKVDRGLALIDLRERSLTIKGQEILTADKVAIRVSLLVYYRVVRPEDAAHNVSSYEERIYEDVQLSARRFLASRDLDAILSDRNEISDAVRDDVREPAGHYGVEIIRADVKDLIFPGNLREIMNQVLETERRAEAKLIEAKHEAERLEIRTAAETKAVRVTAEAEQEKLQLNLQAQANEAKLLAENPQLLKLRQLDALRDMAKTGGKFLVGLQATGLSSLLKD